VGGRVRPVPRLPPRATLVAAGEEVIDVPPVRASRVRVLGSGRSQKNDPNDARTVAIAALRADDLATVRVDDHSRVLRLLSKRHRDLGRLKNKACCRLHALLLEMVPGGAGFRIEAVTRVNTLIDSFEPVDAMGRQRQEIARELAADIDRYNQLLDASKQRIGTALAASPTSLTSICGVGPICAAMIIGESGSIDRFSSKHHCASYNATAPIEASSGPRSGTDSTREATGSWTGRSTWSRFPNSVTTHPVARYTTARSPRARHPKKRSAL
jgi:transposase